MVPCSRSQFLSLALKELLLEARPSETQLCKPVQPIDLNVCWHLVRQVTKPEGLQLTAVHPADEWLGIECGDILETFPQTPTAVETEREMRGVRKKGSLLPPGVKVSPGRLALPRARGGNFF